jgi:CubicO group peptidase (beta-lactamase class C family)
MKSALNRVFQNAISEKIFPGAQLTVYHKGKQIIDQCFGTLTYDLNSETVNHHTVYDIASISKIFATTCSIAGLVHSHSLSLTSSVVEWITEWKGRPQDAIQLRHLLTHSSGLPPTWPLRFEFEIGTDRDFLINHILNADFARVPSYTNGQRQIHERNLGSMIPGSNTRYSDLGFITLGVLVERISQSPFPIHFAREIAGPLGLTSTTFFPDDEHCAPTGNNPDDRGLIQGIVHDSKAWLLGGVAGHAGLFSTSADLARFGDFVRCADSLAWPALSTLRDFGRRVDLVSGAHWGYGWKTNLGGRQAPGPKFSELSFGHDGFTGCFLWIDPEAQLTMALSTNRTFPITDPNREKSAETLKGVRRGIMEAILELL